MKNELNNDDTLKFYTLLKYYNPNANNIAVLGDVKRFNKLIDTYMSEYQYNNGAKVIKINDTKYCFIQNDMDITIVLIKTNEDLDKNRLKYRKFI